MCPNLLLSCAALLQRVGCSLAGTAFVRLYIADMGAFHEANDAFQLFFGLDPPSRYLLPPATRCLFAYLFACSFVCVITSQHTLNQLWLQQYTTPKGYASSKSPSPHCPALHSVQAVALPIHKGYLWHGLRITGHAHDMC